MAKDKRPARKRGVVKAKVAARKLSKTRRRKALPSGFPEHLVVQVAFNRQLDFYDPFLHDPRVVVVGAGGIGSWTALQLAKLGVRKITVYDRDQVEPHNLSTTPYQIGDLGKPKVQALARVVEQYGMQMRFKGLAKWFRGSEKLKADIVISAVDTVAGREKVFEAACAAEAFFIDGRIGGENLRTYTVNTTDPAEREAYLASLESAKASPSPLSCTGQQTIYVGWQMASRITHAVQRWTVRGEYTPEIIEKLAPLSEPIIAPTKRRPGMPDPEHLLQLMHAAVEDSHGSADRTEAGREGAGSEGSPSSTPETAASEEPLRRDAEAGNHRPPMAAGRVVVPGD